MGVASHVKGCFKSLSRKLQPKDNVSTNDTPLPEVPLKDLLERLAADGGQI